MTCNGLQLTYFGVIRGFFSVLHGAVFGLVNFSSHCDLN